MADVVYLDGVSESFDYLKKIVDELVDRIYSPFKEVLGSFPGEGWDTLDALRGLTPAEIQEAAKMYKKKRRKYEPIPNSNGNLETLPIHM